MKKLYFIKTLIYTATLLIICSLFYVFFKSPSNAIFIDVSSSDSHNSVISSNQIEELNEVAQKTDFSYVVIPKNGGVEILFFDPFINEDKIAKRVLKSLQMMKHRND